MARCTAPIKGHRTASGRASCPVCGGGYQRYNFIHLIHHILQHIIHQQVI